MPITDVTFANRRGQKLSGKLHGELGRAAVVSCHGMMSNKNGIKHRLLAEQLERRGLPLLRFDFAGRGESEGTLFELSTSNEVEDLDAAIEYLCRRGVERVALFGSSLGGAVALLGAARDERVVAVATLAAVGHLDALVERNLEALQALAAHGFVETAHGRLGRGFFDDAKAHDVLSAVRVLYAPLLVIHGEEDDVVPCSDAHDIATTARNAELELVPGAAHTFEEPRYLRPMLTRVVDFLCDKLGAVAPR